MSEQQGDNGAAELEALALGFQAQDAAEGVAGEYQQAPRDKPAGIKTGELIGGLLLVTCNKLLAPRRGAHWALEQGEAEAVGEAYGDVIDKHFPDLNAGPEVAAVALSLAVFGPRLAIDAEQKAARADNARAEQEGEPDAG